MSFCIIKAIYPCCEKSKIRRSFPTYLWCFHPGNSLCHLQPGIDQGFSTHVQTSPYKHTHLWRFCFVLLCFLIKTSSYYISWSADCLFFPLNTISQKPFPMNTYRFFSFFVATEHEYITIYVPSLLLSDNYLASYFSPLQTRLWTPCSCILASSGEFFWGRDS